MTRSLTSYDFPVGIRMAYRARLRLGLAGGISNNPPGAPPRCGGAPAAVRTHPEHAPDGPDTGGHLPGPPGRAPGAGAMGSASTTTSKHNPRGCLKRQSAFLSHIFFLVFRPSSLVVNATTRHLVVMGSIPNWVTTRTSAKRTLRSRVQFPESSRPGNVWECAGQWFLLGRGCRRSV